MDSTLSASQVQRVLIVDDEHTQTDAMRMAFESPERDVTACNTFEDARNLLLHEDFNCVITDVRLGAFNGLQLAIIAKDRSPETKLIVFSGFDDPVLREEAERIGATYLVKPLSAERLLELVADC